MHAEVSNVHLHAENTTKSRIDVSDVCSSHLHVVLVVARVLPCMQSTIPTSANIGGDTEHQTKHAACFPRALHCEVHLESCSLLATPNDMQHRYLEARCVTRDIIDYKGNVPHHLNNFAARRRAIDHLSRNMPAKCNLGLFSGSPIDCNADPAREARWR
jgi:hypothetical protein